MLIKTLKTNVALIRRLTRREHACQEGNSISHATCAVDPPTSAQHLSSFGLRLSRAFSENSPLLHLGLELRWMTILLRSSCLLVLRGQMSTVTQSSPTTRKASLSRLAAIQDCRPLNRPASYHRHTLAQPLPPSTVLSQGRRGQLEPHDPPQTETLAWWIDLSEPPQPWRPRDQEDKI
jgi:hypothetical protein